MDCIRKTRGEVMVNYKLDYNIDYLMSYNATLGKPEIIGPTPEGFKMHTYITGGEVSGPDIVGKILPEGADWFTLRPDGIGLLNVRTTIKTNDGALIYLRYRGITDMGPEAYNELIEGKAKKQVFHVRINPILLTAHSDYLWLNRLFLLGIGKSASKSDIIYDVYAIR